MNKKSIVLGIGALAIALVIGSFASSASAYKGNPSVKGPNYSTERHEAMEKAFEAKDYTAWKSLMQNNGRVTKVVNESNFAKFAEAHELAEKGDLEGARKIRQDLGLGLGNGNGKGSGNGQNRLNCINR